MRRHARAPANRSYQRLTRGQAMTEYIVVILLCMVLLIAATAGNPSPVQLLVQALKTYWTNFSYMISLP